MATAQPLEDDKRRAETDAAVRHRAHVIHASVGGPRTGALPPPLRQAVRDRVEKKGLPERTAKKLVALLASVETLDVQKSVLRIVQAETFVRLEPELQQTLVARLTRLEPDAARLAKMFGCLQQGGLSRLDSSAQRLAVIAMTSSDSLVLRHLPELLACDGIATLGPAEQRDVLGFFVGPRLAKGIAPMRKNRMRLMWNARRQDLLTRLRAPAFRRASAQVQADTLTAFFHETVEVIHVMNATALNGHAVIVFGRPDDRRALSYGRRWVAARGGGWPQPRLYAPDPTVSSGWTKPTMDGRTPYSARVYRVSRLESWRLVGWIESSFVISDDHRATGLGPGHLGGDAKSFVDDFEQTLASLVGDPKRAAGKPACFLAGRPHTPKNEADDADDLLATYLKT